MDILGKLRQAVQGMRIDIERGAGSTLGKIAQTPLVNLTPAGRSVQQAQQVRARYLPQMQRFSPQLANVIRNVPLNFTPTIGQQVQRTIINPARVALDRKQPLLNRGIGAVQAGFNITPIGQAYNVLGGGAAGAIGALRTGKPLESSIRTAMSNPNANLAETGLGIKNPYLALGINVLAGNPRSVINTLAKGKGVVQGIKGISPKAFNLSSQSVSELEAIVDTLKSTRGISAVQRADALKGLQNFLEYAAPGYKYSKNRKALQLAEKILDSHYKVQNNIPFPKMGITGSGQSNSKELKKMLQQPVKEPAQVLDQQLSQTPPSGGSSGSIVSQKSPYFNTKNYNIPSQAKGVISKTVDEVRPEIEKTVGTTLTNEEAVNFAKRTNQVLEKTIGREQTLNWESALLKARQKLADASRNGTIDQDYIDNLLTIKTQGTDIARKLQSFSISADPTSITFKDKVLEAILKVNTNTDEILREAQGIDFNDANQAINFYRKFIKPTTKDYLNLIRYNSMLSSPITHMVNAMSNAINTGLVAPVEKTLTGTLDFLNPVRIAKGQPQKNFAIEGPAYSSGMIKNFGDAARNFARVLTGKIESKNLDIDFIPIGTDRRTKLLSIPTRMLEASDQFFSTLARGGETAALKVRQAKGVRVGNIETTAAKNAAYRVFRSELHEQGQGHLLNSVDDLTEKIMGLRSSKNPITSTIANFTLPFVRTPMNIIKQGIEYSPVGFATLPGAANKTQQLSKAIMGTTGALAAAMFVASGRTTWAEPTDPNGRARFRAAGLQPYAIKIGDNWVSFQKLPPALSFPLAFMAAMHDAQQKKTIDQSQFDAVMSAMAKFGNFYSDQSYLKNIGDLVSATKGSSENITRFFGNYPQQVIPFRALLGWMARLTDPIQRKVNTDAGYLEQQVQNLLMQIPLASRTVPPRLDEFGQTIPNQNRFQNAFSPLKMTTERPEEKAIYDVKQKESLINKNIKAAEEMMEQGKPVNFGDIAGAEEKATITFEGANGEVEIIQGKIEDKLNKKKVELSGGVIEENGKLYYRKGTSIKVIDFTKKLEDPKFTGSPELDKRVLSDFSSQITKKRNEIQDLIDIGKLTPDQGETLLQGLTQKLDNIKATQKVQVGYELTGDPVIDKAIISRQKGALTAQINEIVDYVQEGKLTAEQGRSLIDRLKAKNNRVSGGGSKKKLKVNYRGVKTTAKPIKVPTLKLKIPKSRIPKYKPIKPLKIRRVYATR